ncbi:MAG: response regulator [Ignavibacteriota bacterium]
MKALVVDDDRVTRMILQATLSPYAGVCTCEDGSEAVRAFQGALDRDEPFDLVCLDLVMPIMGGLEALTLIRQQEQMRGRFRPDASKVIIATASDDKDTIEKAFHGLCDAYLVKPFDTAEFNSIVECLFPIERLV